MASVKEALQVLLMLSQAQYAKSEIHVQPRDTEAVVGQLTYLNCSTSLFSNGILWYHYPVGATESIYIYYKGQLQSPNDNRFQLDKQRDTGEFNLVIPSVEIGDAGIYVCQEEGGQEQHKAAKLIVLDANPECGSNMKEDGVIGNNNCGIEPEEIQLSCTLSFHGNIPPNVEWSEVGKDNKISEGIHEENSTSRVTSFLTISGHQNRSGSSFECQTSRSVTEQSRCISDVIRMTYVFSRLTYTQAVVGETTTCLANSTQPCLYEWKWSEDKKEVVSDKATIVFLKPGLYICEAACKIRQKTCSVVAKLVQVSPVARTSASSTTDRSQLILVVVTTSIMTAAVVTILLVLFYLLYWRPHQRYLTVSTEESKQMLPRLEIYGLAVLNEELFISRIHCLDIEVYDATKFTFTRQWRVMDLINPTDVICNGNHLCLFDSKDLGQDCEIFTVTSDGDLVNKWSTGNNFGSISAANDSHVILTAYPTSSLIEYSSDGMLLRTIVLTGADILNPWHAIKLTNGDYIVCNGRYGLSQHRVCAVRLSAESNAGVINIGKNDVVSTFGGERGLTSALMNSPIRLDVSTNGSIYVADHMNGRILVLDAKLKLKSELIPANEHGLRRPRRLHLDKAKDRLLVGDYFQVLVCQLSKKRRQWFDIKPGNES